MAATRGSSAFRTASPSAGSAAGSSAFALAIRSMLPARSRWVGCTASTTPTSGRGDLREPRDLTDRVHAHLEDGRLVRGLEPKQGHRQPGLGVEVPLVPERDELAREDVGGDLLGDRLARGAGDADDAHRVARPPPGGKVLEGAERVRHDDLGCVAQVGGEVNGSLDEHRGGAGSERVGDERVAVGSLAGKGDEDGPGADAARVDRRTGDRGRGRRSGPLEPAAGGAEHVLEADRWRHTHPAADFGRV